MGRMKLDQSYEDNFYFDDLEKYEDSFQKKKPLKMKKDFKEKTKEKNNNRKKEFYDFIKSNEKIDIK